MDIPVVLLILRKAFFIEMVFNVILPPDWSYATARSINNNWDMVGWGYDGTTRKGFIYSSGFYTELLPPFTANAYVYDINNSGEVVGWGDDVAGTGDRRSFVYSDGFYTEIRPPGWSYVQAYAINDSGWVVGEGHDSFGIPKGFLATPEPVSSILFLTGAGVLAGRYSFKEKRKQYRT